MLMLAQAGRGGESPRKAFGEGALVPERLLLHTPPAGISPVWALPLPAGIAPNGPKGV